MFIASGRGRKTFLVRGTEVRRRGGWHAIATSCGLGADRPRQSPSRASSPSFLYSTPIMRSSSLPCTNHHPARRCPSYPSCASCTFFRPCLTSYSDRVDVLLIPSRRHSLASRRLGARHGAHGGPAHLAVRCPPPYSSLPSPIVAGRPGGSSG